MKRLFRFPFNVLRILRATFILWLLERYTHPEYLPVVIYGRYVIAEGDLVVVNWGRNQELMRAMKIEPEEHTGEYQNNVTLRVYRRPSA